LALVARSSRLGGLVLVNPAYRLLRSGGMGPSWIDYVTYGWNFVFRRAGLTVDMNRSPPAIHELADRAEAEAMQRDSLVVRYFGLRYLIAQKRVMNRCAANAHATTAPLLLIQGARDALVDPRGNDDILAGTPSWPSY
jgi:alpha-beta hydrolase superfamily lysophospholipase